MDSLAILATNHAETATITCADELADQEASNLGLPELGEFLRTSTTSTEIVFDFGSSKTVQWAALVFHNLTPAGTIQLIGASDAGFTSVVFDSSSDPTVGGTVATAGRTRNNWELLLDGSYSARYWKLVIADSTNPDGYLQARVAVFGELIQAEPGMAYGAKLRLVDPSEKERTPGGSPYTFAGTKYRELSFAVGDMDEAVALDDLFEKVLEVAGTTKDIYVIPHPDDPSRWRLKNVWGSIEESVDSVIGAYNGWSVSIRVAERVCGDV